MTPGSNPFDPFGFITGGPLAFWNIGWRMMEAWQKAWLPLLGGGAPGLPMLPALSPLAPWIPGPNLWPQIEARLTPIAGESGNDAARLSMRVQVPAFGGGREERLAVEALIARQQGREVPWLGCLNGANVVYPNAGSLPPRHPEVREGEKKQADESVTRKAVAAVRKPRSAKAAVTTGEAAAPVVGEAARGRPAAAKQTAAKAAVAPEAPESPARRRVRQPAKTRQ